ncbi:phage portal protein [Paenirhodobacter enshiensis]|uniref:Phage portal protein n=1 Tax=Paenirhodobacter enshiensis TaxID=1105367 RepID=A0A086XQN4_9RHOB|nr:phage portal protein [Paenirhodobacter enshiensis]KFI24334.1 phage portal protein [Paenirhodobacter enshiensis]
MSMIGKFLGRSWAAPPAPAARVEPVLSAAVVADAPSGVSAPAGWLRDVGWSGQSRVKSLPRVSPTTAQKHATVFSCCNVIAGDLSKVPLKLYQRGSDGREHRVRDHPAAYLLNVESAPDVPAVVMRYALGYVYALRGNAYAYAPRDGGGELTLIDMLLPDAVSVLKNGRDRFYDIEDGAGVLRRAPARSVVHLRYMALDGWTGRSPIEVAAESVGIALAGQEAAARNASGTFIKAYVKMADAYDDDEAYYRNQRRLRATLDDPEGKGVPILGESDEIKSLDISAADQQLLESRRFDREQIASIYRVPPTKLQILEYGVKANSEQAATDYLTDCLLHWGGLIEQQYALSLLTDRERRAGMFFRHDFDTLLRPTTKERYDALKAAVGGPFMTANEARQKEGLEPRDEGDQLYPPSNMTRDAGTTTGDGNAN